MRTTAVRRCWTRERCSNGCSPGWPALGYTAKIGVELEFYLLNADGSPFQHDIHAYSLENANALDPLITDLYETLGAFTRLEGIQTEYGPGQVETNLVYTDALEAADDAARLKYAAKEVARRHGKIASFMPKPFSEHSGSSQHLHISLWRDGEPAFAPVNGDRERTGAACDRRAARTPAVDHAVRRAFGERLPPLRAGLIRARQCDVEPRQPQRRGALAGRDGSDRHPHRTAQRRIGCQPVLAGGVGTGRRSRRHRGGASPTRIGGRQPVRQGHPLPESLGVALALATQDDTIAEILGADSVHDFAAIARSEWEQYSHHVSDWERHRYLSQFMTRTHGAQTGQTPRFGRGPPSTATTVHATIRRMRRTVRYRRNRDLLVRAEQAGYDSTLLAQHVIHPSNVEDDVLETWSTLAALAEATSRIELIGAIKPLLINPLVFAKVAANIAEIADGRLAINVVSGWFLPELEALGLKAADHDDRYAYTRSWLESVLDLWAGKQVDIDGAGRSTRARAPHSRRAATGLRRR